MTISISITITIRLSSISQ